MSDISDNYQKDYTGDDDDETDFPASTSTKGLVESGWLDYGRIYPAGDVDWFKVNLTAGEYYKGALKIQVQHFQERMLHGKKLHAVEH